MIQCSCVAFASMSRRHPPSAPVRPPLRRLPNPAPRPAPTRPPLRVTPTAPPPYKHHRGTHPDYPRCSFTGAHFTHNWNGDEYLHCNDDCSHFYQTKGPFCECCHHCLDMHPHRDPKTGKLVERMECVNRNCGNY